MHGIRETAEVIGDNETWHVILSVAPGDYHMFADVQHTQT